ncbi:Sarcosine dehydrogenase [Balamuthia mandrillaris]
MFRHSVGGGRARAAAQRSLRNSSPSSAPAPSFLFNHGRASPSASSSSSASSVSGGLLPQRRAASHAAAPSTTATSPASSASAARASPRAKPHLATAAATAEELQDVAAAAQLPDSADVVIIGGGVVGASTLFHLTELGVQDVVLLDRNKLTSGTTWHSAGLLWRLRPNDVDIDLLARTRALASTELEARTGLSTGWVNNGGLFIASNKERLDEYKRMHTLGKHFGIESHILGPSDIKKVHPLCATEDVYGALYSPGDGTIEPAGITEAYVKAARMGGAKVFQDCVVQGFDINNGAVAGVRTSMGTIRTKKVVNCAGAWARKIGKMANVNVPLVGMKHAYVITESIPGIENTPNVRDHDQSVYLKLQGSTLCVGGYEMNPLFWENPEDDFPFSLFDLDWDVFEAHITGSVKRVPAIAECGIKSTVCGPESFTPDHKPLLGESPQLSGFYLGCGFNSAGIMLSGGCGEELAYWVRDGRPRRDMFSYDINRFHPSMTDNNQWINEASHESYSKNYFTVYPHDEPLAFRNVRKSPLHALLAEQGCIYGAKHGWERPNWFLGPEKKEEAKVLPYDYNGAYPDRYPKHATNGYANALSADYNFGWPSSHEIIGREHRACRDRGAIFDQSAFGKFFLEGPQAQAAVDWLCTNRVHDKPVGACTYTSMCNERGGVECDLTVNRIEDDPQTGLPRFYIVTPGATATHDWHWISTVLKEKQFDVVLRDETEQHGVMGVMGRISGATLADAVVPEERHLFADHEQHFPFSTNRLVHIRDPDDPRKTHQIRALRITFVGELGWEIHTPKESCVPVYRSIMAASKAHEGGLSNAGYRSIDTLSQEKSYKHWHEDLRATDTPLEAGLSFICKLKTEVPFLGREALEKQKNEGLRKRLVCLLAEKEHGPIHGGMETILRDGEVVGFVRRAAFGFSIDKNVAYGYVSRKDGGVVDKEWLEAKQDRFEIECLGKKIPAVLHSGGAPFDPKNLRIKGIYA